jgi:glycosyltransferase involved in cell wall biosynthesis
LVSAFQQLKNSNVHLLIAGNGPEEINLKTAFGNESTIHFLAFQNQSVMPVLYAMSNVFVLPSLTETWGLAINEAMAAGRAVLASDGCGCAIDLVEDNVNGYVFKLKEPTDLLQKLELITHDFHKLEKMGLASANIISNWSFVEVAQAIEESVLAKQTDD